MDDSEAKIVKYLVAGLVALVLSGVGSCQMTNHQIGRAIENGADPMEAACALSSGGSHNCTVIVARKGLEDD